MSDPMGEFLRQYDEYLDGKRTYEDLPRQIQSRVDVNPSLARDVPMPDRPEATSIPVAQLHGRGTWCLRTFISTAAGLAVLALVVLAADVGVESVRSARKSEIAGRDPTLSLSAELMRTQMERERLIRRLEALESSESGRQCMITMARGDYDDFLRQLGWHK